MRNGMFQMEGEVRMQKTINKSVALFTGLFLSSAAMAVDLEVKTSGDYVSPESVPGATTVDVAEAHSLWEDRAYFVDPRKDSDWEAGRIPGAIHLIYDPGKGEQPMTESTLAEVVPKDADVVFYCNAEHCDRSAWSSALAAEWGWENVHYFRGGFPAWTAAGYPAE